MLTVLSLFDYSGVWAGAFEAFGCSVVQVDLKHGHDINGWSARTLLAELLQAHPTIDGVVAAPPCTAFARSGAHAWPEKDRDGRTAAAVELVRQTLRTIDFLQPKFWAVENPIGRIGRLVPELGRAALTFDPYDYAGWTTSESDALTLDYLRRRGERLTIDEVALVRRCGAYTKRTVLWGRFETPPPHSVKPLRCSTQGSWTQGFGGDRESTKAERSITPEGFALSFAAAQVGASTDQILELRDLAVARSEAQQGQQLTLGGVVAERRLAGVLPVVPAPAPASVSKATALRSFAGAVVSAAASHWCGVAASLKQVAQDLVRAEARPVRECASALVEFTTKVLERPSTRWHREGVRDLALELASLIEREEVAHA